MVRGVLAHPNADHPRHKDQEVAISPESGQSAVDVDNNRDHFGWRVAPVFSLRGCVGFCLSPGDVLAVAFVDPRLLPIVDAVSEGLVNAQILDLVWQDIRMTGLSRLLLRITKY